MGTATEGNPPPVMPQGNLVEVLGPEVRRGSPGELMVESSPSGQRPPRCKKNKGMSDEAADAAALTYLLTHWNWKWNQARGNYSTCEQELLAGMLVLSPQSRLVGSNPVVWLCDQELVRTFQKRPAPEKAKLRPCLTYLSQLRLSVHHIQGIKNECADYISRNNFDDMIGASSEQLAKEAFSRMDVHLDLNMTMIQTLDGLKQVEHLKEFEDIYKRLEKRLEPVLVNQEQWKRDKTYLSHEERIVVPSDRIPALLKWTHESSGHVGADRTLRLFKQWFHFTWSDDQLRKTLQPIMDKCWCRSCKPGDIRDIPLY